MSEQALWISAGKAFQVNGKASAEAPRCAGLVWLRNSREAIVGRWSEHQGVEYAIEVSLGLTGK